MGSKTRPKTLKLNLLSTTTLAHMRTGIVSGLTFSTVLFGASFNPALAQTQCVTTGTGSNAITDCTLASGADNWTSANGTNGAINGDLRVGTVNGVQADLLISGIKAYSKNGYIGQGGSKGNSYSGVVTVSGPGAEWNLTGGDLYIGGLGNTYGKGKLIIENGGVVNANSVQLATAIFAGSQGALVVKGEGSILNADELVGLSGYDRIEPNPITILDKGQIVTNSVSLGRQGGAALVSGAGSRWLNSGHMASRSGLAIENGGEVKTKSLLLESFSKVTGQGSVLHVDEGFAQEAEFGVGGTTVSNGGRVEAASIAINRGYFNLESGGLVTTKSMKVSDLGSLSVAGEGSLLDIDGKLTAEGFVTVSDGALLKTKSGMSLNSVLFIGGGVKEDQDGNTVLADAKAAGQINPETAIKFVNDPLSNTKLVFNHTNSGYLFSNTLTGGGQIDAYSGETIVTGDLSQFYTGNGGDGTINVDGKDAKLVIKSNLDTTNLDTDVGDESKSKFAVKSGTLIIDGIVGRTYKTVGSGTEFTHYSNDIEVWGTQSNNEFDDRDPTLFGRLGGSGTVGSVTLETNARIAPGNNSAGTLTVMGALEFKDGSVYEADVAGNGTSDKIVVKDIGPNAIIGLFRPSGVAQIGNNVNVEVNALDSATSYQNGQTYTILTVEKGIDGQFARAVSKSAFLDVSLDQKENQVDLKIAVKSTGPGPVDPGGPTGPKPGDPGPGEPKPGEPGPGNPNPRPVNHVFQTVAKTDNQYNTAGALGSLAQSGPSLALYNRIAVLSAAEARTAYGRLSGEVHASTKTALINDSHQLRNAVNDRIRAAFGDVAAVDVPVMGYGPDAKALAPADVPVMAAWGQAFGVWSETKSNGNASKLDQSTGGFVTGFDAALAESWRLGVMAGYSRSTFDVDAQGSSGNSDNYHVGVYGGGHWGALSLRSGLGYSWHSIETARSAAFSGFEEHLKADYDAATFQAFGEVGYRIDTSRVSFEPFANLAHVRVKTDGFTEKGGIAGLTARSDTTDTTFTTLGLRASTPFSLGATDVEARGTLGWQHAYGDITPASTLAFATGNAFSTAGVPIAEDTALVEAGVDFRLSRQATLGVSYTGQFGSGLTQNAVDAKLGVKF
ncbi:autotransporter domain-containing protein [Phyllobacterium myrsinacearum]|uniref:Outer membrane autotransporter protein n=1 Tax=Phyllobacterium myrsinacearum TaxID=28101 RepID=A0A839ELH1_9HYPH|nr:autotransporter domain-containing protein [Phyllobacterium myrsinacearum]MBA8879712.1 outer membrane autotransporter protein [Phyllobacterium myrsinacearum]